ncbi:MAG: PKD domain-containing protein, partial [bacterium]|nr:PKD domain-containing protein [bacterium]
STLCRLSDPSLLHPTLICDDNGDFSLTLTVTDDLLELIRISTLVHITNVAPEIEALSVPQAPVARYGQPVEVTVKFSDRGLADVHAVQWQWGDGTSDMQHNVTSPAIQHHSYAAPGLYQVSVTVLDKDGAHATAMTGPIVVYDASGGFVTGGGWMRADRQACPAFCDDADKVFFRFISSYKRGAIVPTGMMNVQLQPGHLNFQLKRYLWLVVDGATAQFKGIGTINGQGEYTCRVTISDADVDPDDGVEFDRLHIQIVNRDDGDYETVVYDNAFSEDDQLNKSILKLGAGSIVIHTGASIIESAIPNGLFHQVKRPQRPSHKAPER